MRRLWTGARNAVVIGVVFLLVVLAVGLFVLAADFVASIPGGFALLIVLPFLVMLINREAAARAMNRHATAHGWAVLDPAGREWPWTGLRRQGTIRMRRAWAFEAGGLPVVAGDLRWTGNALAGATESSDDKGVFVVIRLPADLPPMAMRVPHQIVGDAPHLSDSALRLAFATSRIPAWTVTGGELFTIETTSGWLRPAGIGECVRRALLVAELLASAGADPAAEPAVDLASDGGVAEDTGG